ncbi:MAG: TonB-dependent receptor [Candidatus Solibacter usitatus]|nr:TonB-dependent receptor [Candidatus Solibacter usitatus]
MTVTGTITGTVTDPSRQVVVGATLTLSNDRTGELRVTTTNEVGVFMFPATQPAGYSLKAEAPGFKTAQRTGLVLTTNERLALGEIQLSIGAVTETISVVAQGATVQTASSESSAVLTASQLESIQARGRDVVSLLRLIPGVQYQADPEAVGGSYGTGTPNMGGTTSGSNILAVDGVISNDIGTPNVFSSVTTMDAIGEVKVALNSYQAEYAGNGGAVVQVVTKGGGREYHGTGFWYVRNEVLNANSFFNNLNNVKKPLYRYNTAGLTLGGPIYIPGKFNAKRNALFGFYALETLWVRYPGSLQLVTTPTALERAGDFSQTLDVSGKLIPIKDPTTGQPFPAGKIPANRINTNGVALLNVLPLPNFLNRDISKGNYNYSFQETLLQPKKSNLFKIDWVPTDKDKFFVRGKTWISEQQGYAVAGGASAWGLFGQCYCFTEAGVSAGYTRVFSSSVVMEASGGIRTNHEAWYPYGSANEIDKVLRSKRGLSTLGQWFPQSNATGFIPRYSFGGVPSSADPSYDDRLLTGGADTTISLNDNLTVIRGGHSMKAGFSYYRLREYEGEQGRFSGTIAFGRDTNNPFDSNYAYSNAALGNFQSYQEATARYGANERQTVVEWFLQDSWKVNRKLVMEYGVRFTWYNQMYPARKGEQGILALDRYDLKKAPVFFRPAFNSAGQRMAQNPLTGQFLSATYIGAFVPGTGDPGNGGVVAGDSSYPRGFEDQQPVLWGPRAGFSYDPFGKGKTAIRAAAAILYNYRLSKWNQTTKNPPVIFTPITYYGNLSTFLQSGGVLAPSDTNSYFRQSKTPTAYNLSFAVEQDLSHAILLNVSYMGTLGRHVLQSRGLNTIPYGTRFLPQNQDPTNPGKPLPDNFMRPYPGYNNLTFYDPAYSSNYHGLLVSLSRRFSRGVQFGVAYTYSKFMTFASIPIYRDLRVWSYGKDGGDQTHNFVGNFTWSLPKASKLMPNRVARFALDDWALSGIVTFASGQPSGVGFSTTDGTDMTGGGDGQRIIVTGKAQLPPGDRSYSRWFNTSVFARPPMGSAGNAPRDVIRLPGVNSWDLSIFKNFPVKSERRYFQFRWEMYNAFNHTQFSGVDTTARFDLQGSQVNARFGQVTSTRTPRVMQGALRFTF